MNKNFFWKLNWLHLARLSNAWNLTAAMWPDPKPPHELLQMRNCEYRFVVLRLQKFLVKSFWLFRQSSPCSHCVEMWWNCCKRKRENLYLSLVLLLPSVHVLAASFLSALESLRNSSRVWKEQSRQVYCFPWAFVWLIQVFFLFSKKGEQRNNCFSKWHRNSDNPKTRPRISLQRSCIGENASRLLVIWFPGK